MDEFGETPSYYIWPKGHVEGEPFPEDFYQRLWLSLDGNDFAFERV